MTRLTRRISLALMVGFLLSLSPILPSASASQRVVTWNLRSKYVTKAEAVTGLPSSLVAITGPTGLRSWIVLPSGYTARRCWPVLYLLHAAGAADEWLGAQTIYQNLPAIVVIPGGGPGQYTNWWSGGARSPGWENWFFDELMPRVSKTFSVCPQRRDHAIAGSSMGGFGAMYLASQRPEYFGTAASFSGVIAISDPVIEFGFGSYSAVWGPPGGFYELGHDPSYLLPNLSHTRLFVYVGNGTPIVPVSPAERQAGALGEAVMRSEASVFLAAAHHDHIGVRFEEHDGLHTQNNWDLALAHLITSNPFGRVADSPKTWQLTTTEQHGTAWGYRFSFAQPPGSLEMFTLSDGVLRGTGSGRVTLHPPDGRRIVAKLPFVLRDGVVLAGHSGVPVYQPSSLPVTVVVRPKKMSRAAPLRVSFKTQALRQGHTYELKAFQSLTKCTVLSIARVAEKRGGRIVRFTLWPGDGPGHPRHRWCKGPGAVNLTVVQTNVSSIQIGRLVGATGFLVH
jgi:S-formylglutathione hydrolase FrmB